jgi:hypothetical protein
MEIPLDKREKIFCLLPADGELLHILIYNCVHSPTQLLIAQYT